MSNIFKYKMPIYICIVKLCELIHSTFEGEYFKMIILNKYHKSVKC